MGDKIRRFATEKNNMPNNVTICDIIKKTLMASYQAMHQQKLTSKNTAKQDGQKVEKQSFFPHAL